MSERRWFAASVLASAPGAGSERRRLAAAVLAALLCAACSAVGPDYVAPSTVVPATWSASTPSLAGAAENPSRGETTVAASAHADLASWWRVFGDPVLDDLVERALAANNDLRVAAARVRAARATRKGAQAALLPDLNAGADFERRRSSGATLAIGQGVEFNRYTVGFDASWELDIFGGLRRGREQADAGLAAADADLRNALVTLLAEVARNYVEMRSLAERIDIAERNARSQSDTVALARWRYEAGLIGDLNVQQAEYNLAETLARIPTLQASHAAAGNRIAVLLGAFPGSIEELLADRRQVPLPPREVAVGVPADLLRRRPDLEAAERRLAAATAAVGVATADLYPRLTLNGAISVAAADFADLDAANARGFSVGPSLRWNVFDAGRVRSVIEERSAAADEALAAYDSAVLTAFEEASNALVSLDREQVRRDRLAEGRAAAFAAEELARLQYENGLVDFQQLLDAQRALLGFEETLASSSATVTTNVIALYKALGGGWENVRCDGDGCAAAAN